jgi:hypothetical protein
VTLAVWGAVLATATAIAQLVSFWRDRPRLAIELTCTVLFQKPPQIIVTVSNLGRQPTTIKKAALLAAAGDWTIGKGSGATQVRPELDLLRGHVVLVEPGNITRLGVELHKWPNMFMADTPMRPYVIDSHNRRTWGPAAAVLRMILNTGVAPRPEPTSGT